MSPRAYIYRPEPLPDPFWTPVRVALAVVYAAAVVTLVFVI